MRHALPTLLLQLAFAALTLVFGVLALRVAPRPGRGPRCDAWFLTGATFTTTASIATFAGVLAFPAVAAGPGSALYKWFMSLSPVGNDARSVTVLGFVLILARCVVLRRPAPSRPRTAALLGGLLAAGGLMGVIEGAFVPERQYSAMAVLGAVTSLALFGVLYVALLRNALDWPLWTALALYAAREAMNVNLQSLLARIGFAQVRGPGPRFIFWSGLFSVLLMLACTLYRLAQARGGNEPPSLLERLRG